MTLKNWLDNGWLIKHATNSQEISDLLQVADRDLKDCETRGLSADWQLGIAYNAALQTATTALAACGFRSGRDAHHHRVIQSLPKGSRRVVAQKSPEADGLETITGAFSPMSHREQAGYA